MMTLQHAALSALAIYRKVCSLAEYEYVFREEIPWILLPDALRFYTGNRYITHFEQALNGECAWIEFPSDLLMQVISKENFYTQSNLYGVPKYSTFKPCAIGERMNLKEFDCRNYAHQHYHSLRIHMHQDMVMDDVVRGQLVDVSGRFDDRFVLKHGGKVLTGQEFREQNTLFEKLCFVRLVRQVYKATGMWLDQNWYKDNVLLAIEKVYEPKLVENTWKYMVMSDDLLEMMKGSASANLELLINESKKCILTPDLIRTADYMHSEAYIKTFAEL